MTISDAGIRMIEGFEGFSASAYQDQRGIWSIGYGHTRDVHEGDTCTPAQAQEWLASDLQTAQTIVNELVTASLNQNQFDALTSFCVAPETKILTADFRWIPAHSVATGLQVWGFDEEGDRNQKFRKLRIGVVESVEYKDAPRVAVHTTAGSTTVTRDHRFLAQSVGRKGIKWKMADNLTAEVGRKNGRRGGMNRGQTLLPYMPVWSNLPFGLSDWFGGFLDGEGYATVVGTIHNRSLAVGFTQNPGDVFDKAVLACETFGFKINPCQPRGRRVFQSVVQGGLPEVFRFVGQIPTVRLKKNAQEKWSGVRGIYALPKATVLEVEEIEDGPVVSIQTNLKTFISDGFLSHNCYNVGGGNFGKSTMLRELNAGNFTAASAQFPEWNKTGGKVSNGLVARRAAEQKLFDTPMESA